MSERDPIVTDETGRRYLLRKRSAEASLVLDPRTGTEIYLPNERLTRESDDGEVDPAIRLLAHIASREAVSVRTLLAETTYCESDLHALLAGLEAGGLIVEQTVDGERGYAVSEAGLARLDQS